MVITSADTVSEIDDSMGAVVGGIIIGILGLLAILFPFVTGLSLSLLFGSLLVVGALVHVAHAFGRRRRLGSRLWQIVLGLLYGFAGISLLANPVLGLATLTVLVIAFLLVDGILETVWALRDRGKEGWGLLLGSGIISLLAGVLLWLGFPSTATWAVGLLFGLNLVATGIALATMGRRTSTETVETERPISG
ncbi:HdeD family acid-resistance protein [Haloarchaeobius baliensis]|uniref:HdeD family acid-resistance protein n=1 Tax=Haloarchaeobius baliensis TaxID=1670458 RepID=UPI003F882478